MCLLARAQIGRRNKHLFLVAALTSLALKMVLASRWSNFDVGSYEVVASLVLQGKSVYANTNRYNYAPLWAFFVAGLKQLSALIPLAPRQAFHVSIAAFLGIVDIALAALLTTRYRYGAGIFFLICPVTILLTGSYSQFDNFALLGGFAAWLLIREGSEDWRRWVSSAGLLGLSLVIKHVFFLFPVWLLFWPKLGSLTKRLVYAAVAYGIFAASFLPWIADPPSRQGIYQYVFRYRSRFYFSVLHLLAASRHFWRVSATETSALTLLWMALLVAAGIILARTKIELFPMYLLAMVGFSPALNDYYLAMPILACAIFYPSWPGLTLSGVAIIALFSSPGGIFGFRFTRFYYLAMLSSQVSAGLLFAVQMRWAGRPEPAALSAEEAARRGALFALAIMTGVFLLLLVKGWTLGYPGTDWILPDDNG